MISDLVTICLGGVSHWSNKSIQKYKLYPDKAFVVFNEP